MYVTKQQSEKTKLGGGRNNNMLYVKCVTKHSEKENKYPCDGRTNNIVCDETADREKKEPCVGRIILIRTKMQHMWYVHTPRG